MEHVANAKSDSKMETRAFRCQENVAGYSKGGPEPAMWDNEITPRESTVQNS